MRVIAGEFRSRVLKTLPGDEVRPTPDRLRETLFNILSPVIEGAVFVDAYAGTGSVGIEALSRGALHAIFLEKSRTAVEVIQSNLLSLGLRARSTVVGGPVVKKLPGIVADIVFLDPPYPLVEEYRLVLDLLGAAPPRLMAIVQHSRRLTLPETAGELRRYRELRHGENALSFYGRP